MKTQVCMLLTVGILCGAIASARGEDAKSGESSKPSVEEAMAKFIKLGPGVYSIKKDKKGRILSCITIGQARVSTVLGKGKGLEIARQKADLDSSGQFVKWLKENVTINLSSDDETVVLMEGTEGGSSDSLSESGKAVEKSSKKMQAVSQGLVRGLEVIYKDVDGDGKTFTLVKGFKADNANGAKRLRAELASDQPNSKAGHKKDQRKPAKPVDKTINSEKAISDNAADYLKN